MCCHPKTTPTFSLVLGWEHPTYVIVDNCNITHIILFSPQSTLWTARVFHVSISERKQPNLRCSLRLICVYVSDIGEVLLTAYVHGRCVRAALQPILSGSQLIHGASLSMCWCKPLSIGICINISISLYYEFSIFPIFFHIFCSFFYLLTKCNLHTWYFHW